MTTLLDLKFWPTPPGPATVRVEVNVTAAGGMDWNCDVTIHDADGVTAGAVFVYESTSELNAQRDGLCKAVKFMAQLLADERAKAAKP